MIEGLNWKMPEQAFLERFGRFRDGRFAWGHAGIVAIKFGYHQEDEKVLSEGRVYITFALEALGVFFIQVFNAYRAMDQEQFWRGAFTRVSSQ